MTGRRSDSGEVDAFIQEAMIAATGGVDLQRGVGAIQDMFDAVAGQMAVLKTADYRQHEEKVQCPKCEKRFDIVIPAPSPEAIARASAHTVKAGDTLFRLMEFAKGKPDSRVDAGAGWLQALSPEQFNTVQGWIADIERRK